MGVNPSHFIKQRNRETLTGIRTNIKNPIKFGSMKERPRRVFLRPRENPFFPLTGVE